jgi:uncharacterized protein
MDGGTNSHPPIKARSPEFSYDQVPRYWLADNPIATHLANGVNLLFPSGERFFIRSVRHFADRIEDPELREQVRGFYAQEARHGAAHMHQFDVLRAQGYNLDGFLRWHDRIAWQWIEPRVSPEFRLAVTAALEHYTAIMAEGAFVHGSLDFAHPQMQQLLKWHAAEEIEHKAVAFDVLKHVAPSYSLRMGAMALATVGMAAFWVSATATLLLQDQRNGRPVKLTQAKDFQKKNKRSIVRDVFFRGIKAYIRRDFHPNDHDNYALAQAHLASVGL